MQKIFGCCQRFCAYHNRHKRNAQPTRAVEALTSSAQAAASRDAIHSSHPASQLSNHLFETQTRINVRRVLKMDVTNTEMATHTCANSPLRISFQCHISVTQNSMDGRSTLSLPPANLSHNTDSPFFLSACSLACFMEGNERSHFTH